MLLGGDRLTMKTSKLTFVLIGCLLISLCIAGCSGSERVSRGGDTSRHIQPGCFRFVAAADPQLFRGKQEDLERAVRLINQLEPEFVVMCGDLIETSANQQQIEAYRDTVSRLSPRITLYNLPGNHDLGRPVRPEAVRIYQQQCGPLWYEFRHEDSLFIALSSDILSDPNAPMHRRQTDWLTGLLASPATKTARHIFVLMHHPLYLESPEEPGTYSNMPLSIRKTLLDLFVRRGVRAVFSGHYHDNKENRYQGMDLITTNSVTCPLGKIPAGFRVVEVCPDNYEQSYYTLEELEKQESVSQESSSVAALP